MSVVESLPYLAIVFLVLGFHLNTKKDIRCWPLWIACSLTWLIYAVATSQTGLVTNNLICLGFHVRGIISWRKDLKEEV